jgi:tetratricopeptide (TPR) repeat protein
MCIAAPPCLLLFSPSVGNAWVPDYCYKVTLAEDVVAGCTRFLRVAKTSKDKSIALGRRARGLYFTGDYDAALRDYDEALTLEKEKGGRLAILLYRADVWYRKGDQDRAIEEYSALLQIDPKYGPAYANRGLAWQEKGNLDRAIADSTTAMRFNPASSYILNNRANMWARKGEYDRALEDADRAIRLDPKNPIYPANRAMIWRMKGDLQKALLDNDKAVQLAGSKSLMESVSRGDTYRYAGNLEKARIDYAKAIEVMKDYAPALTGLALTYEKMGDLTNARVYFERAISSRNIDNAYDLSRSAIETARARVAALESGELPPVIPPAPAKVTSETSVPTLPLTAQIVTKPLSIERVQVTASKQGRRVALVIGNSAYQKASVLRNPANDATAINASLKNLGFDIVKVSLNGSREDLIAAVRTFAAEADNAEWAMVYYSGHGIEVNGRNYLIPIDATLRTDRDVEFETVAVDQVMSAIDGARKLKLVILDACRNNPFAVSIQKTGRKEVSEIDSTSGGEIGVRAIGRGLGEVKIKGASLVVFAAKHGQTALDGDGDNSPFTIALVQRIATPGVEINKLFRLVRDDVMEATAGRQEPYTYGSLPGREDYFFVSTK